MAETTSTRRRTVLLTSASAMTFVILIGAVSLFSDATYEGGRSLAGQFLQNLGSSGAAGCGHLPCLTTGWSSTTTSLVTWSARSSVGSTTPFNDHPQLRDLNTTPEVITQHIWKELHARLNEPRIEPISVEIGESPTQRVQYQAPFRKARPASWSSASGFGG